jgi:hypothetical protein
MNNTTDKEQLARWVQTWRKAGEELEKIRREEIRNSSTQTAILALNDAFISAIRLNPIRMTSGLVEQQRLFRKMKRK